MPDKKDVNQEKKKEDTEKKTDEIVDGMDKNEGQTQNGIIGGTGSDLDTSAQISEADD